MSLLQQMKHHQLPLNLLEKLGRADIEILDGLVDYLAEKALLNKAILESLLAKTPSTAFFRLLNDLIQKVTNATATTPEQILKIVQNPRDLDESLRLLLEHQVLNSISLSLILEDSAPTIAANIWLILIHSDSDVDQAQAKSFLQQTLVRQGLDEALTIYSLAGIQPNLANLNAILDLANIMKNPLLIAIFEARRRNFCMMSEPTETLSPQMALDLINTVNPDAPFKSTFKIFDKLAKLRPFPGSQSYLPGEENGPVFTLKELAINHVQNYLDHLIMRAKTREEYLEVKVFFANIRLKGMQLILNDIRYQVAASQIEGDMTDSDSFSYLMMKVDKAICAVQFDKLGDFADAQKQSPGYQAFLREPMKILGHHRRRSSATIVLKERIPEEVQPETQAYRT